MAGKGLEELGLPRPKQEHQHVRDESLYLCGHDSRIADMKFDFKKSNFQINFLNPLCTASIWTLMMGSPTSGFLRNGEWVDNERSNIAIQTTHIEKEEKITTPHFLREKCNKATILEA